jgi:hypothetical protein
MSVIHELPQHTLQDIPKVLRAIADQVEAGDFGKVTMGALVIESEEGNVHTFGVGGADYYRAYAMFNLGIANLVAKRGTEYML